MGDIARGLGLGSQIEFRGKTYKLAPWTFKIQGMYEQFLENKAMDACKRMRPFLSDEEYRDLVRSTAQDVAAGFWSFGRENVQKSLEVVTNLEHLLYLMLSEQKENEKVTRELVRALMEEKMEEAVAKIAEANADPNPKGEADPT